MTKHSCHGMKILKMECVGTTKDFTECGDITCLPAPDLSEPEKINCGRSCFPKKVFSEDINLFAKIESTSQL